MEQSEFKQFAETYSAAWSFHKPVTQVQVSMAFELLRQYPLRVVLAGIKAHCVDPERGQFPPKPADVVAQMEKWKPQRISADEAWTMLPKDESETVVWTDEMAEAHAIAVKEYDKNARRMAFRSAYERIVDRNKAQHRYPVWSISVGWCEEKREVAINQALKLGRIKPEDVPVNLLQAPTQGIAGLLANQAEFDIEKSKENLCKLKQILKGVPV